MTYVEAIQHLYSLGPELATAPDGTPRKFQLDEMRTLCAALGNPQDRVPCVLIAGTNGKGSTAATLASILNAAGYRTGLYTSPHLVTPNERIQLSHPTLPSEYGNLAAHADGPLALSHIAEDDFARCYSLVDETANRLKKTGLLPHGPSFFERLTALAFLYFAGPDATSDQDVSTQADVPTQAEIMILEVGLGGRLDATNIVTPLISIVTDIALDHQDYLGATIALITAEKCGILREGGTLITLPQLPEANQAIGIAATALNVHAINAAQQIPPPQRNSPSGTGPANADVAADTLLPRNRYTLTIDQEPLEVDSPLAGHHQQRNIALALTAALELRKVHGYNIPREAIERGIRDTQWPGRLELLPPNLLLDVAHNPAGAWTLRSAIASLPEARPRTLIFSCLKDKSLEEMSRILFPLFDSSVGGDPLRRHDHIILAPIANPRAAAMQDLLDAAHALDIPAHAAPHLAGALAQARQITPEDGLILATGSVYLVGEIRNLALNNAR